MIPIKEQGLREAVAGEYRGHLNALSANVVIDSRKVTENALFVAMKGENVDSHRFIAQAYASGAGCVFASREFASSHEIDVPEGRMLVICEDPVLSMGDLAAWYRRQFQIPVVGVTGSVGKTSTKDMIAAALSGGFKTAKTPANLNNQFGLPLTVFGLEADTQAAVIEMGMNHFGEIRYLAHIARPDIGVITNIGVSHIEFLGSQRGILQAKTEMLEEMDSHNMMLFCGDDPLLAEYAASCKVPHLMYGFGEANDVRCTASKQDGDILEAEIRYLDEPAVTVRANTIGNHMVYAMLAAYAAGRLTGLTPEQIREGIAGYTATGMRMESITTDQYRIIDDSYNASPASMKAAIDVICKEKAAAGRRAVAILGDMFEMGFYSETGHREVGAYAAEKGVDLLLTAGSDSRYIAEEAAAQNKGTEIHSYKTLEELKADLFSRVRSGDIILVKASRRMAFDTLVPLLEKGPQTDAVGKEEP